MDKEISAGDFKAHRLKLMDEANQKRTPLAITKRGKPVEKFVPIEENPPSLSGFMKDSANITGNIIDPVGETWK